MSEFEVPLEKFIVILRLPILKAAIYLKDFDDLYQQQARETSENTKIIRKSHG